ncbi:hypothetical protein [Spirosoma panaciterrae]|uniref:hypothetical protein n=1 Tax=Spirosoma panaciterrae TaxID=496058 RepID=UPI0012FB81EA|nr:hypothetical protein [Spirosoma panaciterrae]
MKKPRGCLFSLALLLLVLLGLGVLSFYGSMFFDRYQRPWAYSTSAPLLVGHWKGQYVDPDNIAKTIELTIFDPEPDAKRWSRALSFRGRRKGRRRTGASKRSFDGQAIVVSRLGREMYAVNGSVDKDDYHRIKLTFDTETSRNFEKPTFYLLFGQDGRWYNNELTCKLDFSYRRKDGSSFWSSADPRFGKQTRLTLHRVTP